jgi:hypothetical protein
VLQGQEKQGGFSGGGRSAILFRAFSDNLGQFGKDVFEHGASETEEAEPAAVAAPSGKLQCPAKCGPESRAPPIHLIFSIPERSILWQKRSST